MAIRLIHTSDLHVGMVFRYVDNETMPLLQEARLEVINTLADLAKKHVVKHILVAGDIYDTTEPTVRTRNALLERMRKFSNLHWHLLPGNHDHYKRGGLWDRIKKDYADHKHIHLHTQEEPAIFHEDSLAILPAPLRRSRSSEDATTYMKDVEVPEGYIRVGLAHGSAIQFGSEQSTTHNYISPDITQEAHLSYLALGDWHGQKRIHERCYYSGTPEMDSFDTKEGGQALLVDIENSLAPPLVQPLETGRYKWLTLEESVNSAEDIAALKKELHSKSSPNVLCRLTLEGTLSLETKRHLHDQIIEGLQGSFRYLHTNTDNLLLTPTLDDFRSIDQQGFIRRAVDILYQESEQGNDIAKAALERLYREHMKLKDSTNP